MMRGRRNNKRIWWGIMGVFVMVFVFSFLAQKIVKKTDAANTGAFQAGYIISDYQMTDYNSMNESQIQAFLKSKNSCNDTRTYLTGNNLGYVREEAPYSWHVANGHYVCLADEKFAAGTAAHIIYRAAQDYHINPKVLIVLLQKEQGLITDTLPNSVQYRSATGYGCPDTAACSSKYYGFNNQVRNAAAMFHTVMEGGWSNYPVGNNYIQYSPNAACGGSIVNVRNKATSALYRYTPYQPNAAALASGYGTAHCGAYGNRNFYNYFEDWFGGITFDGWPSVATMMSHNRVANEVSDLGMQYRTHIEHYGWLGWVGGGAMAGTAGYSARVEALQLKLENMKGIEYRTHVQNVGWTNYVADGAVSGTTGMGLQVEAVQIRLSSELQKNYDVYYRAHVASKGWMKWVKNDQVAGTTGKGLRVEAIQVKIVKKDLGGPEYTTHVQNIGWMGKVTNGKTGGTTGQSRQVEAVKINLSGNLAKEDIKYRVHVQNIGWMDWVEAGKVAGTTGYSLRVEAIEIKLPEELEKKFDIYYRAHVQGIGWMQWVKDGELAGTTGKGLRVEALQMKLMAK